MIRIAYSHTLILTVLQYFKKSHWHLLIGLGFLFLTLPARGQIQDIKDPNAEVGEILFSNESALPVIRKIEELTGKPVLRKQNLPNVSITFESQGAMTKQEALLALESLLSLNGIAITEVGDKFLKAVISSEASSEVPRMVTDPAQIQQLPASQKIYAALFQLKHMGIQQAQERITPLLSRTVGNINPFPNVNSLLVTDALINLQHIQKILQRMDRPTELREDIHFISLDHTSATDMQQRLERLTSQNLRQYFGQDTTIQADERTNQLMVITPPGNIQIIRSIVKNLDINVDPLTESQVIPVSNAKAETVASLIQELIAGQQETENQDSAGSQNAPNAPQSSQPQFPSPRNENANNGGAPTQNPQQQTSSAATDSQGSPQSENGRLQFSEYIQVIADERSNSIIAYGTASDVEQVRKLVSNIDLLLPQVKIEVVIAEVTLDDDQVRGIESFGLSADVLEQWNLSSLSGPSSANLQTPFSMDATLKDFSIDAVFNTAQRKSNVEVLSSPTIVTTHNREAKILVGEQRPILTSTQSTLDSNNNTFNSINFENIGIDLTVTPLIGDNNIIQLEILQSVENVTGTTQIGNNDQPIIGNREASSFVSVANNEILILGGLQSKETSITEGRVAIFGSIPIVGELFTSDTESVQVRELVLFIKPTIVKPSGAPELRIDALNEMQDDQDIRKQLESWNFLPKESQKDQPQNSEQWPPLPETTQ